MPFPGDLSHPALPDPDPTPPVQREQRQRQPWPDRSAATRDASSHSVAEMPPSARPPRTMLSSKHRPFVARSLFLIQLPSPSSSSEGIGPPSSSHSRRRAHLSVAPAVAGPSHCRPPTLLSAALSSQQATASTIAPPRIRSRPREPKPNLPILPRHPVPARPTQTAHHRIRPALELATSTPRRLASWPRDPRRARLIQHS